MAESTIHLFIWCPALSYVCRSTLQPIYYQLEDWGVPSLGRNNLVKILLGAHIYAEDPYIYKLASSACLAINNLCQTLYIPSNSEIVSCVMLGLHYLDNGGLLFCQTIYVYTLQFTLSKTSLSFETYGLVQIKTTLKSLTVYINEEFSWKTFF